MLSLLYANEKLTVPHVSELIQLDLLGPKEKSVCAFVQLFDFTETSRGWPSWILHAQFRGDSKPVHFTHPHLIEVVLLLFLGN